MTQKEWYEANREKVLKRARERYREKKEEKLAYQRKYYAENSDFIKARQRQRYRHDEDYQGRMRDASRAYQRKKGARPGKVGRPRKKGNPE